ncbi:PIG-L family deacetylase [Bacillus carboniphilus]|uniref:PIG-L family deacetylase n=1 Tax=Bacillus carboniphilus TaxID=86663 RepID=A0ABY9JQC1_9BACI|nr:PIG-L family deacetylase [Bacillus carboniphilus]WLR41599.1 PIG-L family deacetylase [Bacillus carboniphilus]
MKRFLFVFSLICISFLCSSPAYANQTKTAVFYSPHQDDEILSMGHAIKAYLQKGYDVHVVLITDGASSYALNHVNTELNKHQISSLSKEEFSHSRNLEFIRSSVALGVTRNNIHLSYLPDGGTTQDQIEAIMLKYKTRFPNAKHLSFSYYDGHIDHANSGKALQNLYRNGIISEPKYYIKNIEQTAEFGSYEPYDSSYSNSLNTAMSYYRTLDPLMRMYAIGEFSVGSHFNILEKAINSNQPQSKYHLDGQ